MLRVLLSGGGRQHAGRERERKREREREIGCCRRYLVNAQEGRAAEVALACVPKMYFEF
jgi:hypothetical protein